MMAKAEPKKEETLAELKAVIAGLKGDVKAAEAAFGAEKSRADRAVADYHTIQTAFKNEKAEREHLQAMTVALEKRIQRMSGYLDRIMEKEDEAIEPVKVTQASPAPKGPAIYDISLPKRETANPRDMWARPDLSSDIYPQRRF